MSRSLRSLALAGALLVTLTGSVGMMPGGSVAAFSDRDRDALSDTFETTRSLTDPGRADSDGDGLRDSVEDPDGDGLGNLGEQRAKTDPQLADTDGDGTPDNREDADGNGVSNGRQQDRRAVPRGLVPSLARAAKDEPPTYRNGCHSGATDPRLHACVYGDRSAKRTIVLFGDSHAAQWLPALARAGAAAHWRIVSITKSGCPAADLTSANSQVFPSCAPWRSAAIAWIKAHKPRGVLLGSANGYRLTTSSGRAITGNKRKAPFGQALRRTMARLPDGPAYGILADSPRPAVDVPACLRRHPTNLAFCGMSRSGSIKPAWDDMMQRIADDFGASFVNLQAAVCPYDPCPVVNGPILIWRDDSHLTATMSTAIGPTMRAAVQQLLEDHPAAASAATRGLRTTAAALLSAPGARRRTTDTDGDGLRNGFERAFGLAPGLRDTDGDGLHDPSEDEDGDDLGAFGEQLAGTSPLLADTDGDGLADGREDADGDGIINQLEQDRFRVPRLLRPTVRGARNDAPPWAERCQTGPDETAIHPCVLGDRRGKRTIVLVGDSHGTMWGPAFDRAGRRHHWRFVTLTKSGCPAPDITAANSSVRTSCKPWRDAVRAWLQAHRPDLIILTAAPQYALKDGDGRHLGGDEAAAVWGASYARTLAAMPAGVRVVLLSSIPRPRLKVPECLATRHVMSRCTTRRERGLRPLRIAVEQAAAATAGVRWDSLAGQVCPYDPCPVVSDGILMWRDRSHITATFGYSLGPSAQRVVREGLAADPPPSPARRRSRG